MSKKIFISIGILCVALCLAFVFLCPSSLTNDSEKIDSYLAKTAIESELTLSFLSDKCDSVYVIAPYSTDFFSVNSNIDVKDCIKDKMTSQSMFDGICQLLFTKGNKVVAYAEIPRTTADFATIGQGGFHVNTPLIIDKNRVVHKKAVMLAKSAQAQATEQIEAGAKVIKDYYALLLDDKTKWDSLTYIPYMTKNMHSRELRISCMHCNPFLRTMDYADIDSASIEVKHLDGKWYMASYKWNGKERLVNIPIRVTLEQRKRAYIDYVTPIWGGESYGDSILTAEEPHIKMTDKKEFVTTFFKRYTWLFINMSETWEDQQQALRKQFLTEDMQKEYDDTREAVAGSIDEYFDPIVGGGYFDTFFYRNISVKQLSDKEFSIAYGCGFIEHERKYTVSGEEGNYKITKIEQINRD